MFFYAKIALSHVLNPQNPQKNAEKLLFSLQNFQKKKKKKKQVIAGKKREAQILREFLDRFDTPDKKDGKITKDEFTRYVRRFFTAFFGFFGFLGPNLTGFGVF
jgi:hypothetical protein